jgi:hypothetical protein
MPPKYHPTPLSGGDRKALTKELAKSRAMTGILAERSEEKRRVGEALIREADNLACQSWNERMWSDGGSAQPSPTIGRRNRRRPSDRQSAAAFPGLRSSAIDAGRQAASTSLRSTGQRTRRCICWRAVLTAGNAGRRNGRDAASWNNWRRGADMTGPRHAECGISIR